MYIDTPHIKLTDKELAFGKTVLIIGVGNIGQECAKRFKAFGTKVLGADIFDSKCEFVDEFFYMDACSTGAS